jgi:pimeloyl-ACP methyl ester carboxylesterase
VQGEALDCGHYLPEEQPEATAARLLGFFSPAA